MIRARFGLVKRVVGLDLALTVLPAAGGGAGATAVPTSIAVGSGVVVLPLGARAQLGFQLGPVDGVMGGVRTGPGHYRFFGAGQSVKTAACPGTPGTQGVYASTSDLGVSPPSFASDCRAPAGGTIPAESILGLASAPFSFE